MDTYKKLKLIDIARVFIEIKTFFNIKKNKKPNSYFLLVFNFYLC